MVCSAVTKYTVSIVDNDGDSDVIITAEAPEDFAEKGYGLTTNTFTEKKKDFFGEYVSSFSEIDDKGWSVIKTRAEEMKSYYVDEDVKQGVLRSGFGTSNFNGLNSRYIFDSATYDNFKWDDAYLFNNGEIWLSFTADAQGMEDNLIWTNVPLPLGAQPTRDFEGVSGAFKLNGVKIKKGEVILPTIRYEGYDNTYGAYETLDELNASISGELDKTEIKF